MDVRDSYRARIQKRFETLKSTPWSQPSIQARDDFLQRMQTLALEFNEPRAKIETVVKDVVETNNEELELQSLLNREEFSAAFFYSRRLVTRGEDWAKQYMDLAKSGLDSDDEVLIP